MQVRQRDKKVRSGQERGGPAWEVCGQRPAQPLAGLDTLLTIPTLEGQLRGLYAAPRPYTVVVGAGRSLGVGGLPQNSFTI